MECLKRYVFFSRARRRYPARTLKISHVNWNRWCHVFDAPPLLNREAKAFYAWLLSLLRQLGLREGDDYVVVTVKWRAGSSRERVRAVLVRDDALDALLSLLS